MRVPPSKKKKMVTKPGQCIMALHLLLFSLLSVFGLWSSRRYKLLANNLNDCLNRLKHGPNNLSIVNLLNCIPRCTHKWKKTERENEWEEKTENETDLGLCVGSVLLYLFRLFHIWNFWTAETIFCSFPRCFACMKILNTYPAQSNYSQAC